MYHLSTSWQPLAPFSLELACQKLEVIIELEHLAVDPTRPGPESVWPSSDIEIFFGAKGNSADFLRSGWSTPEDGETWAIGGGGTLVLPLLEKPATYVLVLSLRPHVVPGKLETQRLAVSVNGAEIGRFSISGRTVRACRIPWSVVQGQPDFTITFGVPDAATPAHLGGSDDGRPLGIAFTSLKLYADVSEAALPDGFAPGSEPVPVNLNTILAADRLTLQELMLRFENLGQNCEFGLVQRRCQAEPLGLLRFSSTPLPKLLAALEARFAGMGLPESMRVQLSSNGREFMINDSRFGFLYHAFVDAGAMANEALHQREVRRVPFLIRKLLEDLGAADKIFVFKGMGALLPEEVYPLALALRRYGPNTLLMVTLADAQHPPGSVEARAPGFLVGYLGRFAPTENASDFELAQWVHMCRAAYRLSLAAATPAGGR